MGLTKESAAKLGRLGGTEIDGESKLQSDCIESIQGQQHVLDDDANEATADLTRCLKWRRILTSFVGGKSWHALEAAQGLHTTCLHTDIAGLEARGLKFNRERVTVLGYAGSRASVVRYTLARDSLPQARRLLGLAAPQGAPQGDEANAYLLASRGSANRG